MMSDRMQHRFAGEPNSLLTVDSKILGETRPYRVLLPAGYDEHVDRRYPVIYMHDGQGAFEDDETVLFGYPPFDNRPWPALDPGGNLLASLMNAGRMRRAVVVGVDALDMSRRIRDYIPRGDSLAGTDGRAFEYVRFIVEELKPTVDAAYRTLPDPINTVTVGYSLGGVVAVYMGLAFGGVFTRVGALSGSVWLPQFNDFVRREPRHGGLRIYLDSGEDSVDEIRSLRDHLVDKKKYVVGEDLMYVYQRGGEHAPADFASRLPSMMGFLLPVEESIA